MKIAQGQRSRSPQFNDFYGYHNTHSQQVKLPQFMTSLSVFFVEKNTDIWTPPKTLPSSHSVDGMQTISYLCKLYKNK